LTCLATIVPNLEPLLCYRVIVSWNTVISVVPPHPDGCIVEMEDKAAEDKRQRAIGDEGGIEPEHPRPRNAGNADDGSNGSAGAFTEEWKRAQ
jgi:hypothetical protein